MGPNKSRDFPFSAKQINCESSQLFHHGSSGCQGNSNLRSSIDYIH